jgi:hypothetical protein
VAEPSLRRFQRIGYHRRGLGGSTRPGRPALPCRPRTPWGSSTTSAWIAPTWWGTPWVE